MNIKVLGSGSEGNSYLIDDGETTILLDAGLSIKQLDVATGFGISKISACFLSHSHGDHCKGAGALAKRGVNIFLSEATKKEIGLVGHRLHTVTALDKIKVGSMGIMCFDLVHDVENLGFIVSSNMTGKKLLYITDSMYCKYRFTGITHMLVEANYDAHILNQNTSHGVVAHGLKRRIISSHMSIETLLGLLRANDLRELEQVYLIHMSDNNGHAEQFKESVQRVTGAEVIVC